MRWLSGRFSLPGVGEQVLAKAAEFARAEAAPSLLVGEIALVRGAVAAASEQWEQADLQLRLATEVTKRSF
jgi:dihydroxyacetone kinase DhaKLM complex PTS-EIIA-like component DhaM